MEWMVWTALYLLISFGFFAFFYLELREDGEGIKFNLNKRRLTKFGKIFSAILSLPCFGILAIYALIYKTMFVE